MYIRVETTSGHISKLLKRIHRKYEHRMPARNRKYCSISRHAEENVDTHKKILIGLFPHKKICVFEAAI